MSAETKIDDGGPAFPLGITESTESYDVGMTLRDWFAGMTLRGLVASRNGIVNFDAYADDAYKQADAMLKARKGGQQ